MYNIWSLLLSWMARSGTLVDIRICPHNVLYTLCTLLHGRSNISFDTGEDTGEDSHNQ